MEINVIVKQTNELSNDEKNQICGLFKDVFHKNRSVREFLSEYLNTFCGFSYHALAIDSGKIVGHNAYIPFLYKNGDDCIKVVLSTDAMIDSNYRGKGLYKKLLNACGDAAINDGFHLRIGFPNDNSFPIQSKYFKMKRIGRLSTYIMPVNVGVIKTWLYPLNVLTIPFSYLFFLISFLSLSKRNLCEAKYKKDRKNNDKFRYQWFGGDYKHVKQEDFSFVYKNADFKGIPATFLMDINPMSKRNFDRAFRYIYTHEFPHLSMIIYVGNLKFTPLSLIKLPHCIEPKHFNFMGKIYDDKIITDDVFNIDNWEVNLSNYDLL